MCRPQHYEFIFIPAWPTFLVNLGDGLGVNNGRTALTVDAVHIVEYMPVRIPVYMHPGNSGKARHGNYNPKQSQSQAYL